MLRRCYAFLVNKKCYYIVNCVAYAVFVIINAGAYFLLPTDGYTWIFVVTKFLRYSNLGVSTPVGIALFHTVIVVSVFIAPIGMGWIKRRDTEAREYIDNMPPPLEIPEEDTV